MGILKNTVNLTMLEYSGDIDKDEIAQNVSSNCFMLLDENSTEEQTIGWVDINNPTNNLFENEEFLKSGYLALSLRIDSRKVPKQALQDHLYKLWKQKKGGKLSSDEKEAVRIELLKKVIPNTKIIDVVVFLDIKEAFIFSNSEKDVEIVSMMFENTFKVSLVRLFTYTKALKEVSKSVLDSLYPTSFSKEENIQEYSYSTANNDSDNVSLLNNTRFIGQEFLIWLWFITNNYEYCIENITDIWINDKIVLESVEDSDKNTEKVTCCYGEMVEAKEALKNGKRITNLSIGIKSKDEEYKLTIDDKFLDLKGCKTPKIDIDKDDIDGAFLEKIFLLKKIKDLFFEKIFKKFISIRTDLTIWNSLTKEIINIINS